jgi:hypothetical protein
MHSRKWRYPAISNYTDVILVKSVRVYTRIQVWASLTSKGAMLYFQKCTSDIHGSDILSKGARKEPARIQKYKNELSSITWHSEKGRNKDLKGMQGTESRKLASPKPVIISNSSGKGNTSSAKHFQ